jgi:hypothetical protein
MAHALLNPDDVEGWRGLIEDGEVVKDHETVLDEEARERREEPADATGTDEADQADAVAEEPAPSDDELSDEELADEETGESAPADEDVDADANGDRPGDRRRAPARGGSRGRAPARAR